MTIEEVRQHFAQDRFAQLAGIQIDSISDKSAVCSVVLHDHHKNALDTAQGGLIYTLADLAFAVAANAGEHTTVTLNSTIHFVAPGRGKKLIATAAVQHAGRHTSVYEVSITDENETLIAVATFTGYVTNNRFQNRLDKAQENGI